MAFDLDACLDVLERTPGTLQKMLGGLSEDWTLANEGPDTWSPYDVIGHLVHGERTDWVARMEIILSGKPAAARTFAPFDRFAQFEESRGKSMADLLAEFARLRAESVSHVRARRLTSADLDRTGVHPDFGTVTLRQLLATWTAHDLDHIVQISRVMARHIGGEVGPWAAFIRVVRDGASN